MPGCRRRAAVGFQYVDGFQAPVRNKRGAAAGEIGNGGIVGKPSGKEDDEAVSHDFSPPPPGVRDQFLQNFYTKFL
jgi:hypothetical protein